MVAIVRSKTEAARAERGMGRIEERSGSRKSFLEDITLGALPAPPPCKIGWPWTSLSVQVAAHLPADLVQGGNVSPEIEELLRSLPEDRLPKISVVTPSYRQGEFIEETIRSVLLQGYPKLEFFVVDGGSKDETLDILKKYNNWITEWVSEPDQGQSDAINKGWRWATGDLLAYLNSDDIYLPGALWQVAAAWIREPTAVAVVGAVVRTNLDSVVIREPRKPELPSRGPLYLSTISPRKWFLPQQSGFFNTSVLDEVGRFARKELHYTMDREIYYRLARKGSLSLIDTPLATFRFHEDSKSCSKILEMYREDRAAIAMSRSGGIYRRFKEWLVANAWRGRGHWKYANAGLESESIKAWHTLCAAMYSPHYLGRRKFWVVLAKGFRNVVG
jgi:glycosyltransferase involved in cell wall biosynthesis